LIISPTIRYYFMNKESVALSIYNLFLEILLV
jgi:hypothetical protein